MGQRERALGWKRACNVYVSGKGAISRSNGKIEKNGHVQLALYKFSC